MYKKWARCLPMLGNVLAPVGHGACPSWAESVPEKCPKTLTRIGHQGLPGFYIFRRANFVWLL